MPKIELNRDEQNIIIDGLDKALASARRQQNTSKQPAIAEVYKTIERNILAVQMKIADAK